MLVKFQSFRSMLTENVFFVSNLVIPMDDQSEPCYESETIGFLRDIKEHAEISDINWLAKHGKVYAAMEHV